MSGIDVLLGQRQTDAVLPLNALACTSVGEMIKHNLHCARSELHNHVRGGHGRLEGSQRYSYAYSY